MILYTSVHNFGYVKQSNMIRVVPIADIVKRQRKDNEQSVPLTYADATNVSQALTKFLSPAGKHIGNPAQVIL